jgi:glycosyltransferase involved in cell wall biosynthesis
MFQAGSLENGTKVLANPPGGSARDRDSMRVSVILPVMDETESLKETIRILLEENRRFISEILIVACARTTPESVAVCEALEHEQPDLIKLRWQKLPFLGGAMRDSFNWATGSHVLMMASDLETDPRTVKDLIATAETGFDIVTATRWTQKDAFQGYDPLKYYLNWVFQQVVRTLYGTKLSDLTLAFRIFRAPWVKNIRWEELKHPFLLETILKPMRLGATIAEVPTVWRAREEGASHNTFWQNFVYFRIAVKTRLRPRRKLLLEEERSGRELLLEEGQ